MSGCVGQALPSPFVVPYQVSRVLKSLLREMPARMETVAAASLSASLALASVLADNPQTVPPTGNGLNERHRVITDMQARAGCTPALP